jgi:hypothetical protein
MIKLRLVISLKEILTWHGKANQFQTGVEFGLGKYIDASVDYYSKNTTDLIFDRRVGPSLGMLF